MPLSVRCDFLSLVGTRLVLCLPRQCSGLLGDGQNLFVPRAEVLSDICLRRTSGDLGRAGEDLAKAYLPVRLGSMRAQADPQPRDAEKVLYCTLGLKAGLCHCCRTLFRGDLLSPVESCDVPGRYGECKTLCSFFLLLLIPSACIRRSSRPRASRMLATSHMPILLGTYLTGRTAVPLSTASGQREGTPLPLITRRKRGSEGADVHNGQAR